jgi:hypothetical protein
MARRGKAADVDAILMLVADAADEEKREKSEAEMKEWEEDAGLLAPQRRHESREEGPCERSREEEEAEARRRRAGEAEGTIIDMGE